MRAWIGKRLRRLADRVDQDGAPRRIGYSFTFEYGVGIVFHPDGTVNRKDARGCPVWYLGSADYDLAHTKGTA